MGLKLNPLELSSFNALTLLVGSFDPSKPVSDMTYNVFGGTLSLTQSIINLLLTVSQKCVVTLYHILSAMICCSVWCHFYYFIYLFI